MIRWLLFFNLMAALLCWMGAAGAILLQDGLGWAVLLVILCLLNALGVVINKKGLLDRKERAEHDN